MSPINDEGGALLKWHDFDVAPTSPEDRLKAARFICKGSQNVEDAVDLLAALGITAELLRADLKEIREGEAA